MPSSPPSTFAAERLPPLFWWLWAGWLLSALASFVLPFLAFFLTARGMPPSQVGLVVSAFGAGGLVGGPCAGALADRVGRKPTILLTLLTAAATAAAIAFLASPVALGAAVLLFGLASQAVNAPFHAIVADVVPEGARPRAFALAYWARNVGVGLSLVAGGALAARGWALPFLLDAATTLLFALLVLVFVPETLPPSSPTPAPVGYGPVLGDRRFAALLGLHVLFATALWQLHAGLPMDLAGRGLAPEVFGAVLSVNTVLVALLSPFSARFTGRFSPPAALAGGAALVAVGFGAYAVCVRASHFALASAVLTLGEIVYLPVAGSMAADLAPPALRGRYAGALGLALGAGSLAAPLLASAILPAAGSAALWLLCFAACSAVAVGYAALARGGSVVRVGP